MERWNEWSVDDMATTDSVQTPASDDIQRQIPNDYQLSTPNSVSGPPISNQTWQ